MHRFIDREQELQTLTKEYERKTASFVVIYGRRRVGKTTLIKEFCKDKKAIFFLATEENEKQNRDAFQMSLAESFQNELLRSASIQDWTPLFQEIARACKHEKWILVMDEFQYLGKANPAFPSIFMKLWDEILKDTSILLILCGSLISMMKAQVLNYSSPLYGRRTAQLNMKQIPFCYYADFMPDASIDEQIQQYAVTGGVPKYIEVFENTKDIYQNIQQNILNTSSFLYEEPMFLLQKEVSEIGSYFTLMKTIAAGNHKLGKIAAAMEVKQTNISKYLTTLQDLDILVREVPITEEQPEKSKMGLYFIKDNYFKFWFSFIYPYRSLIEVGHNDFVMNKIRQSFIEKHVAFVYEDICREQMWEVVFTKMKNISINRVGRWWGGKDVEIDIVAYDSFGNDMIFGECKYSTQPKDVTVFYSLQEKSTSVKWKQEKRCNHFIIFSRSGFTEEMQTLAEQRTDLYLIHGLS